MLMASPPQSTALKLLLKGLSLHILSPSLFVFLFLLSPSLLLSLLSSTHIPHNHTPPLCPPYPHTLLHQYTLLTPLLSSLFISLPLSPLLSSSLFFSLLLSLIPLTYTLLNSNGLSITVIPFGGTITHFLVPDKTGTKRDIILGFDDPTQYH